MSTYSILNAGRIVAGPDSIEQIADIVKDYGASRVLIISDKGVARAGLIDRLAWFHAPAVMGADGHPAAEGLRLAALAAMPRFRRVAVRPLGADLLTEYEPIAEVG